MKTVFLLSIFAFIGLFPCRAQVANEYTVTDLGSLSSGQLATLPYFDRYVPDIPAGASSDFSPVCRNGSGVTAGVRNPNATTGAYVSSGSQTNIAAWGTYYWSYWIWDGQDNHYYYGNVTHSPVRDANIFGQIVGYATVPSSGSYSSEYANHGYLRDANSGEHTDLTPGAKRGDPRGISDHGTIVGTWSTTNTFHSFRREADGSFHDYTVSNGSVSPALINNHELIAGTVTIWTTPRIYYPFVSAASNEMVQLPWPSQGSPDTGAVLDMNDLSMIVGEAHKAASPVETSAVRWYKDGGGWVAEDLNELLADGNGDFIIDRAIAINDAGHIIAKGHPDGTDIIGTHTLMLTPDVFPAPSIISFSAADVGPSNATLRAKFNACGSSMLPEFEYGFSSGYGTTIPIVGPFTGTVPYLIEYELTGLSPHTIYHYRGRATNGTGGTLGEDVVFTTPYTYAAWAAEQFGTNVANPAVAGENEDPDSDGVVNRVEYAFGGQALVPGAPPPVESAVAADDFVLAYTRPADRSGVTYAVEQAVEMDGPWQDAEMIGTTVNPDGTVTVQVRSASAVSDEPVQFLRVRVY